MIETNDIKIQELFSKLSNFNCELDDPNYSEKYWGIKLQLVQEITEKYGEKYTPELLKVLKIPCAILNIIIKMERQKLNL